MIIKYRKLPTACTLFPGERSRRRHSSCFSVYWSRLGRTQQKGAYAYVTPLSILDRKISVFIFHLIFAKTAELSCADTQTQRRRSEPSAAHTARARSVSLFATSAFRFKMCEFFSPILLHVVGGRAAVCEPSIAHPHCNRYSSRSSALLCEALRT